MVSCLNTDGADCTLKKNCGHTIEMKGRENVLSKHEGNEYTSTSKNKKQTTERTYTEIKRWNYIDAISCKTITSVLLTGDKSH